MATVDEKPLHLQDVDESVQLLPRPPVPPLTTSESDKALYVDVKPVPDPRTINYAQYISQGDGLDSTATISPDGRICLQFDLKQPDESTPCLSESESEESLPDHTAETTWRDYPFMNIVIMIVGSRGDVQPFLALGKRLKKDGHRVRIATHETFRTFVGEAGLEFFSIGGNPSDLMSYMVKNPGLIPGFESICNGDIPKKRVMLTEMIHGCWAACHSPDPVEKRDFIADAIISNPPAFAHIHCAEAMGIPLMLSFTMPWTATTAFPHPLVNIKASNAGTGMTNYLSYGASELLTWQGVGDIINNFRSHTLGLSPLTVRSGPGLVDRMKVPWTYCMSPALVPKPRDWKKHVDVVGFYFLDLASNYTPPDDLKQFLEAGEPPIYVGFGSVVVDDPHGLTNLIFEATKHAGVRCLLSAGWGGLGGVTVPPHVFILGNVPHDWLFDNERVSAVVHHGGAGTTAIGLAKGRPTVVVPFFGDQAFWGQMIYKAQAGPKPISHKHLTKEKLEEAIKYAISPHAKEAAKVLAERIQNENGVTRGTEFFYKQLPLLNMRCELDPTRLAIWWSTSHCIRLSTFAAQTLIDANKIDVRTLILHRTKEFGIRKICKMSVVAGVNAVFWNVTHRCAGETAVQSVKYTAHLLQDTFELARLGVRLMRSPKKEKFQPDDLTLSLTPSLSEFKRANKTESDVSDHHSDADEKIENVTTIEKVKGKKVKEKKAKKEKKHEKKESVPETISKQAKATVEGVKQSKIGCVTLPILNHWRHKEHKVCEAHEQYQRSIRLQEGVEEVRKSTAAQRAKIIEKFDAETTPEKMLVRRQTFMESVGRAASLGVPMDTNAPGVRVGGENFTWNAPGGTDSGSSVTGSTMSINSPDSVLTPKATHPDPASIPLPRSAVPLPISPSSSTATSTSDGSHFSSNLSTASSSTAYSETASLSFAQKLDEDISTPTNETRQVFPPATHATHTHHGFDERRFEHDMQTAIRRSLGDHSS